MKAFFIVRIIEMKKGFITKYLVIQSLLAGIFITIIILVGETFSNNVINAAIGSSVALLFLHPKNRQNRFKSLVVGNLIAIITFILLHFLFQLFDQDLYVSISNKNFHIFSGISFFICLLVMTLTNSEHVPAAGTSIGLSVHEFDFRLILFVIFSVLFLYVFKLALDRYGKNII